ncbi:hypothetical protein EYF80_043641 [Liparis tanakae]|uniref:Uncharacterized protein n=1 Tax=Liparis tanakae TaxID=230148 RepID=A0A4Z2G035_9TELE|nr:hypothetical protein EYF80_043641 [Liparis tanakae]
MQSQMCPKLGNMKGTARGQSEAGEQERGEQKPGQSVLSRTPRNVSFSAQLSNMEMIKYFTVQRNAVRTPLKNM